MAEIIRMPKMSDTMNEGTIAAWHKKVGDKVKSGELLAEVETDKATMELESYENGTLLYIGIEKGASVPVDGLIAIIGKEGENFDDLLKNSNAPAGATPPIDDHVAQPSDAPAPKPTTAQASPEPAPAPAAAAADIKATLVRMPKMSDTMSEGTIVAWHKKVGDKVKSGELLAEVETDKATMELESYENGTLLYIGVEAGNAVVVDGILAIIGAPDADYKALLGGDGAKPSAPAAAPTQQNEQAPEAAKTPETAKTVTETHASAPQSAATPTDARLKISPLARLMALDKGLNLSELRGSGENGRIVRKDVEEAQNAPKPAAAPASSAAPAPAAIAKPAAALVAGQESYDEIVVSQMRKTIARRLSESMYSAPHFYLTIEVNMDKAIAARKSINEFVGGKISFNDMVIKAAAAALKTHPKVNSAWLGDKIRINHHVHIGVAVAVDEGLLVPVVRFADQKSLSQIGAEVKDLGARAKNKQLQPADWEGSTFTISNLGMFGIDEFTAIINPPAACILAVGGIKETVIVVNGEFKAASIMKVTLSCDHRAVDGAIGASFLQTFKGLLEDPVRILA